jgi:Arc/MetJ-type ribon-helix-helix transcriptional regulator
MSNEYKRKKPIISGAISPYHKKKIEKRVNDGEFASVSDFISQAVSDLLNKCEKKEQTQDFYNLFSEDEVLFLKNIIREKTEEKQPMNMPQKRKND